MIILRAQSKDRTYRASMIIERAIREGRGSLLEIEAEKIAGSFGIKTEASRLAKSETEAITIAKKIGFPLVMKIVSPDVIHKSDVGGVIPGVQNLKEARTSYRQILANVMRSNQKARIIGVLLQRMAPKTFEFVAGGLRDSQFGPTVMFGLGGIYVELFRDVTFRLAPLKKSQALAMLEDVKSSKIISGFRGSEPLDRNSIAEVLIAVGDMMTKLKHIESIDINPLLVYPKGSIAVDVRIMIQ
jgi:acetate---CoA ligase (ADP-forming) subunit beta